MSYNGSSNRLIVLVGVSVIAVVLGAGAQVMAQKLTAGDGAAGDHLGYSVALGDGVAVVGADADDDLGADAGVAFVFRQTTSGWEEEAKLTASDGAAGDHFGCSVAVAGDTIVVGARFHDVSGMADAGAAYVFVWSGAAWVQQAQLTAADAAANSQFGCAVAVQGNTAAVGASYAYGSRCGYAYVFERAGSSWTQQQRLVSPEPDDYGYFGGALALDGDYLLVGANGESVGANREGAAYVFLRQGTTWSLDGQLYEPAPAQYDNFGYAVAINSDMAVVGAAWDDNAAGTDAGSAFVFTRSSGGIWTRQQSLMASDAAAGDHFGISIGFSADQAIIGAYTDDNPGGTDAGAAYWYQPNGGELTGGTKVTAPGAAAGDQFGFSASVYEDSFLVGAHLADAPAADSGAAYVFSPPIICRDVEVLNNSCLQGEYAPTQIFHVWNCGSGTLSYTIGDTASWLYCSPGGGSSTGEPDTIVVVYTTTGLTCGQYTATIYISGNAPNSPQTITVNLTVTCPPMICRDVDVLNNSCLQGENAPTQILHVWNCGSGTLSYTISDNAGWLYCSPGGGSSTGEHDTIMVIYETTSLDCGQYAATIWIYGNAPNSPQTIGVELLVESPSVYYVDATAPPDGTGTTWNTAFRYLQDALDVAYDGVEIRVADGVYAPDRAENGSVIPGDRAATFQLNARVTLLGGYAGRGASNPDARDPAAYPSVLSGDLAGNDGPDFANYDENSYHIVTASSASWMTVLGGFILRGGNASTPASDRRGAGLHNASPYLNVIDCQVEHNFAENGGAGLFSENSEVLLEGCTFEGNVVDAPTGASYGGAIWNYYGCTTTLRNCTLTGNRADYGGGVYNLSGSTIDVIDCTISANFAARDGGGVCNQGGVARLYNCAVLYNSAGFDGGGLYNNYSLLTVTSCVLAGNFAMSGAGIADQDGQPGLVNCTVIDNAAPFGGGGVYLSSSSATTIDLTNCILWGNTTDFYYGPQLMLAGWTTAHVSYCDFEGGADGVSVAPSATLLWDQSNLDVYPLLTSDGRLRTGSPCINAGDTNALPADWADLDTDGNTTEPVPFDIDGDARVANGQVDIGADELVDSDADELPDAWELRYFGSPTGAGPDDDPDGDGLANRVEYAEYGSSPDAPPFYVDAATGDDSYDGLSPLAQGGGVGPKRTIQAALDLAGSGDTVLVAAGTYAGAGNYELDYGGKSVIVRGPAGREQTILDCDRAGSAVDFWSIEYMPAVLDGFTVKDGDSVFGGGLYMRDSRFRVKRCLLAYNHASSAGGGLYAEIAAPSFDDVILGAGNTPSNSVGFASDSAIELLGDLRVTFGTLELRSTRFHGPGTIVLDAQTDPDVRLHIAGDEPGAMPTVIRTDIEGTGTIVIDAGQQLLITQGAVVDLSGETGGGCADPNAAADWGIIEVNGQLVVRDATVRNTNVDVMAGDLSEGATIYNNEINLLQNPPGWGGEFFVEGTSTIECNVIHSEGDRYLDLDPDPSASPRPTIGQNKFYVNILQGTATQQGEQLELRAEDHDNAVGNGWSGAYELASGIGYADTWALERLEVQANAKVNLTNRQGFVFQDPQITIPESIYVKQLKLHPNAVLNTGLQRLYYPALVDENDQPLTRDPNDASAPMANGSRIVDVPLLGFSLKVIAMDDETEFSVRVRTRLRDSADEQPSSAPYKEGSIIRETAPDDPGNSAMQMRTRADEALQAASVAAHGAFARAGEEQIIVAFDYLFCGQATDELIVYLTDSPEVGNPASADPAHYVEVARVHPPLAGRRGSIGSNQFATFFGKFPRGSLNWTRGTYVELELRGENACVWIDNWDPQVQCLTPICGDFDADYATTGSDLLYVLGECGTTVSTTHPKWCLDAANGDHYVDTGDFYAWDTRLHDPALLNLCGGGGKSGGGGKDGPRGTPVSLPGNALAIAGKQGGQSGGYGQQDDFLYAKNPNQVSVQINGSTATTIIDPNACLGSPLSPASDPNAEGHYRGNGRLMADKDGTVYQLHGSQGLIRLSDAAHVLPYGQVMFGSSTVQVGLNPANGSGVPIADAVFSPTSNSTLYVVPVLVTEPGYPAYRAAAKLALQPGSPPYAVQQLYGFNPRTDSRVTVSTVYGQVVFEPDFQHLREVELDTWGNLFVVSAQEDNDNDWVLVYDEAAGNASEVCILLSGGAPTCCSAVGTDLQGPTAMALSADGATMYLASSVNDPEADSSRVYRFAINRNGNHRVTGLALAGEVEIEGMREVSALLERPSSLDLWVIGTLSPTFDEYTTFSTNCAVNPNCEVPMWPRLAVVPPSVTEATAAALTCHDLALPMSALFTAGVPCGTGDFDGGGVGLSDIPLFVSALLLTNPPPETLCTADVNRDGHLDGMDVQAFVNALLMP